VFSGMVWYGLTSASTYYMSFQGRFYGSDDPTNSVIALKDKPRQGPIPLGSGSAQNR